MIPVHSEILFNHKCEWKYGICQWMYGSGEDYAKWNKPDPEYKRLDIYPDMQKLGHRREKEKEKRGSNLMKIEIRRVEKGYCRGGRKYRKKRGNESDHTFLSTHMTTLQWMSPLYIYPQGTKFKKIKYKKDEETRGKRIREGGEREEEALGTDP